MTLPSQGTIDLIATQILFDAKAALASLKQFGAQVTDTSTRVAVLKSLIQSTAQQMGGDLKKAERSVGAFANSLTGIKGSEVKQAGMEVRQLGNRWEETSKKSKYSIDVIRTAMGVLTAMLVNVVLSGIINFAKGAVKAFTDVEESLWRVRNAEIALSKQGVEISFAGLSEGIAKIKEDLKIFSEPELLKGASDFASSLSQYGFTEEQILNLTRGAGVLNVASTATEAYGATVDSLINSLISPQGKSIGELGISFGETAMQAKALSMGLLEAGESASDLTAEENRQVKYQIILDRINELQGTYGEYLDTNNAKLKENAAAWEDLKASAGGFLTAIIPSLTSLLQFLTDGVNGIKAIIVLLEVVDQKLRNPFESWSDTLDKIASEQIPRLFSSVPKNAPQWFKDLFGGYLVKPETPTVPQPPGGVAGATQEETDAFNDLAKELAEVAAEAQDAYDELERLTTQKAIDIHADLIIDLEDIDTEFAQKMEDVERELQQTLQDIAIDTQNKIDDLKRQAREDEMRAELEFQQKMKELRQQFLMDLDDALHARDARQVLSLIKRYENEKQNAIDQKKLDDKLRQEKLAADIRAAQIEGQRRAQQAQLEAARKMQQLEIEKQREIEAAYEKEQRKLEDLKLWNQREAEEIARHAQEKNDKLVAAYEAEVGIHSFYEAQINELIAGYAAANIAAIDAMYAHMAGVYANISQMYANSQAMLGGLFGASAPPPTPSVPSGPFPGQYAEGGSIIADRPTVAIFGEAGREMATFTPLDRTGRDINKVFGDTSGLGRGNGGRMLIEMTLSPDLEARVIENSLSRTADVIARVSRGK